MAKEMFASFAWIVPARFTVPPVPFSVKAPLSRVELPAVSERSPVCLMVQIPPLVERREPVIVKFVPVKLMPDRLVVLRSPKMVVVPVPAV